MRSAMRVALVDVDAGDVAASVCGDVVERVVVVVADDHAPGAAEAAVRAARCAGARWSGSCATEAVSALRPVARQARPTACRGGIACEVAARPRRRRRRSGADRGLRSPPASARARARAQRVELLAQRARGGRATSVERAEVRERQRARAPTPAIRSSERVPRLDVDVGRRRRRRAPGRRRSARRRRRRRTRCRVASCR